MRGRVGVWEAGDVIIAWMYVETRQVRTELADIDLKVFTRRINLLKQDYLLGQDGSVRTLYIM